MPPVSRTRPKTLEASTRTEYASSHPPGVVVSNFAITMGVGTIMEARHLLMLASGAGKADVIREMVEGPLTSELPASVLQMHPRATVIVLGDARTNGREPAADIFGQIAARAGRTYWLNPEPRLYWNYGDSVIASYEQHCEAYECWTAAHLEDFVKALTSPDATRRR